MNVYDLAERIKEGREELNMSQSTLAAKIGVTRQTIYKIEQGDIGSVAFMTIIKVLNGIGFDLVLKAGLPLPITDDTSDKPQMSDYEWLQQTYNL